VLYHVKGSSPSPKGFATALAKAMGLAMKNGSNQVAIAVPLKGSLDGIVRDAIGEKAVKTLQKSGGTIRVDDITIFLITDKIRSGFKSGVIVATYVSTKQLKQLISDYRATDIVFVPWAEAELTNYLSANTSTSI